MSFQSPNNKGKFLYKSTTVLLWTLELSGKDLTSQVKILEQRENETVLLSRCFSRACLGLGVSHRYLVFPNIISILLCSYHQR